MSDVIEDVAAAIHAAQQVAMEEANRTGVLNQRELDLVAARAAIEAMREPTDAMLDAHQDCCIFPNEEAEAEYRDNLREAWGMMIHAALAEQKFATP